MSSVDAIFEQIITQVRALLYCDVVYLELVCPEPQLAHPLLAYINKRKGLASDYGKPADWDNASRSTVHALRDMAIQMGRPWIGNAARLPGQRMAGSVAVVPLGEPGSVLGSLVCMDMQPDAFHYGEIRLLEQVLPRIVRQVLEGVIQLCEADLLIFQQEKTRADFHEQHEFLSLLCHELRRPMTALKGYTELFLTYGSEEREEHGEFDWQAYLRMVQEKTLQLEELVDDVQDVVRMSRGYLRVCSRPVDVVRLCRDMIKKEQGRLEQMAPGDYRLCLEIARDMPLVWADPVRLRQALANLLDNAVKYSPHGGLIELLVTDQAPYLEQSYYVIRPERTLKIDLAASLSDLPSDSYLYITVHDHGVGIPFHLQQNLFRPFTRLEHDMQTRVPGSGLGLYLVLLLVERMGGILLLQSDEGRGTSITLALPVVQKHIEEDRVSSLFGMQAYSLSASSASHQARSLPG